MVGRCVGVRASSRRRQAVDGRVIYVGHLAKARPVSRELLIP